MESRSTTRDAAVGPPRNPVYRANGRARRVLIVDDDPAMRMLCALNLQLEGLAVIEAADGRTGLALARSAQPDLVVTDVAMPGLDGFQMAEKLRRDARTRDIPLIFVSGETAAANESRARALGAVAYLAKPFDPATLVGLVADALARAATRRPATAGRTRERTFTT